MTLPSFDFEYNYQNKTRKKPRICVLEIRDRKNLEEAPIAYLFVEREEQYSRTENGEVWRASIRLSYERIDQRNPHTPVAKGHFVGGYCGSLCDEARVSLSSTDLSRGAIFLDLPGLNGQRIGTYLMNEIIAWAQQWPEAIVCPIELREEQAYDENRARRNQFYEQFGLKFAYVDSRKRSGFSEEVPTGSLHTVDTWRLNIRELAIDDYVSSMLDQNRDLGFKVSGLSSAVESYSRQLSAAEKNPLQWALRRMWGYYKNWLIVLAAFALILLSALKNFNAPQ